MDEINIKKININPSQTLPNNRRGGNTYKLILRASITPKKTRRGHHKKKLQANIIDNHRCTNPQQNISKPISTIHYKNHTPWSSGIYSRDARIVQHL